MRVSAATSANQSCCKWHRLLVAHCTRAIVLCMTRVCCTQVHRMMQLAAPCFIFRLPTLLRTLRVLTLAPSLPQRVDATHLRISTPSHEEAGACGAVLKERCFASGPISLLLSEIPQRD